MKKIILIFAVFLLTMSSSFAWVQVQYREVHSDYGYEEVDHYALNVNAYCDYFQINGSFTPRTILLGPYTAKYAEVVVMDEWTQILNYTCSHDWGPTVTTFNGSWGSRTWGTVRVYSALGNGTVAYRLEWGAFGL